MAMNAAIIGIPKPQHAEIRGIIPEKKKVPRGWPACLKRSLPKVAFQNNDMYAKHTVKTNMKSQKRRHNRNIVLENRT